MSTYSSRLKFELMATGANANTWGTRTNNNLDVADAFIGGYLSKSVAGSADVTLTTANSDPSAEASNKVIELTGTLTGDIKVLLPAVESNYLIYNNTSGSQTITVAATGHTSNGTVITQGAWHWLYCKGSSNFNVVEALFTTTDASALTSGTLNNARLDAQLQDVAGLATTDGGFIVGDGANFVLESGATARTSIGLGTSSDVQFNDMQVDSLGVATAASGTSGEIRATNDITAFYSSDVALKENIENISSPMDKVQNLNGVLFDWKQDFIDAKGGEDGYFVRKRDVGVVAQDVEKVLPEVVGTRPDGVKAVKYDRLCALLIECVKDLQDQVNDIKKGE